MARDARADDSQRGRVGRRFNGLAREVLSRSARELRVASNWVGSESSGLTWPVRRATHKASLSGSSERVRTAHRRLFRRGQPVRARKIVRLQSDFRSDLCRSPSRLAAARMKLCDLRLRLWSILGNVIG